MSPEFPSDLIEEMKIRLREAAGVPSYDPSEPSLPSIPSVAEAVADLDPTLPDYLRSIFCGGGRREDVVPRTISFNSTAACRKLLQSLRLDGSERVDMEDESKESTKGHNSSKDGVTLANILNLELRWPREVEEKENNNRNGPSQVAPVSLSGVDLDNFFSDQKNEVSSRSNASHSTSKAPQVSAHSANSFSFDLDAFLSGTRNETASSAQIDNVGQFTPREQGVNTHVNLSSRSQKFGFFEERLSLDVVNSSADAKAGNLDDTFADWETDFQSASSETLEAKSYQIDPAQSSEDFQSANPTAVTAESRTVDLFHNPANYQSADCEIVGTEFKQIDPFQNSSNIQPDNPESLAMKFRTNDLSQNSLDFQSTDSEAVTTDSRPIDFIQNRAGFQSANLEAVASESRYIDQFRNSLDFSAIIISKSDQNTNGHDFNKFDTGKDQIHTHEVDQLASGNEWFQDDKWPQISTKNPKKINLLENIRSTSVGELENEKKETTLSVYRSYDDLWQSSANEINNTKSLNHHNDDLFDDWQDFAAATDASGNSTILQSLTGDTNASGNSTISQSLTGDMGHALPLEVNLGDVEDSEFGCFMQSDSFSNSLNDLQSSNHFNNTRQGDDSIANRTNQSSNEKTGNDSAIYSGSDISENIIPDASDLDASNYKVDMLLAQMPDLSFMLEESLSIPKTKPGGSDLNT